MCACIHVYCNVRFCSVSVIVIVHYHSCWLLSLYYYYFSSLFLFSPSLFFLYLSLSLPLSFPTLPPSSLLLYKTTDCPERLIVCYYCQLKVKASDYMEHVAVCGSRTDVCKKCLMRLMLKDMETHKCGVLQSHLQHNPYQAPPKLSSYNAMEEEERRRRREWEEKEVLIPCDVCGASICFEDYQKHIVCDLK